mgnify:CR=1 FL=1
MKFLILSLFSLSAHAVTVEFAKDSIVPRRFREAMRNTIEDQCFKKDLVLVENESVEDFQNLFDGAWLKVYGSDFNVSYSENGRIVTGKNLVLRGEQGFDQQYGWSKTVNARITWNDDKVCRD